MPRRAPSPEATVSLGCAINLSHGVAASVEPARANEVLLNGKSIDIAPVRYVLSTLAPEPVRVSLDTPLPIGCGFGVSAAAALSAAFALERRFALGLSRDRLGLVAHIAEVQSTTGLGDVGTQLCGGVVYRRCKMGPLDCVQIITEKRPLYYRAFGELSTKSVLTSEATLALITKEGQMAVDWLERHSMKTSLEEIMDRSYMFSLATGLMTHPGVINHIRAIREMNAHAMMILLGHSILTTHKPSASNAWISCEIDTLGTRFLS